MKLFDTIEEAVKAAKGAWKEHPNACVLVKYEGFHPFDVPTEDCLIERDMVDTDDREGYCVVLKHGTYDPSFDTWTETIYLQA